MILTMAAIFLSVHSQAQVEFHLAYPIKHTGTKAATFPNDDMFRYVSTQPYISSSELLSARVQKSNHGYIIEINISQLAQRKINELVATNVKSLEDRDFNRHIALGVVVDGEPKQVIQGILHPLTTDIMWWSPPISNRSSDATALQETNLWAKRINDAKKP